MLHTVKGICGERTWATFATDHLFGQQRLYLPQQKGKWHGMAAARVGVKEGSMERWMERQTWWIHGGPKVSRPCGVVGIAVMLIDAWLFASAFTVNTNKTQEKDNNESKWGSQECQYTWWCKATTETVVERTEKTFEKKLQIHLNRYPHRDHVSHDSSSQWELTDLNKNINQAFFGCLGHICIVSRRLA